MISISRISWSGRGWVLAVVLMAWCAAPGWAFDATRAMRMIREQCALGPRVPGTAEHAAGRGWIVARLEEMGMSVREEPFSVELPLTGVTVQGVNIWGLPAEDGPASPALILSGHWDTRPWSDRDMDQPREPVIGANDGASGVAAALELARVLRETEWRDHLVLAFWDVEDAGRYGGRELDWGLGSRHAAQHPPAWIDRVGLGINLDMVAGADMVMPRELHSVGAAPEVVEEIWRIGKDFHPTRFTNASYEVLDDHYHWITLRGMKYVDLIGWPYAQWHTTQDTPEHCSEESLMAVGEVVETYLRDRLGPRWLPRAGVQSGAGAGGGAGGYE